MAEPVVDAKDKPSFKGEGVVPFAGAASYTTAGLNGGRYDNENQDRLDVVKLSGIGNAAKAREVLKTAFAAADTATETYKDEGTTLTVLAATEEGKVTVEQVGDSPAAAFVWDTLTNTVRTINLTVDQSPNKERERIIAAGGSVVDNRVVGEDADLGMARSLGDNAFRGYGVIPIPTTRTADLNKVAKNPKRFKIWFVTGSDGLTDNNKSEEFAKFFAEGLRPDQIAKKMVEHAVQTADKNGVKKSDNISINVVNYNGRAVMLSTADGHGDEGAEVADTAIHAIKNAMQPYIVAGNPVKFKDEPVPAAAKDKAGLDSNVTEKEYWKTAMAGGMKPISKDRLTPQRGSRVH